MTGRATGKRVQDATGSRAANEPCPDCEKDVSDTCIRHDRPHATPDRAAKRILVIGGRVEEARYYCREHGLSADRSVIGSPDALRGWAGDDLTIRLVGTYGERRDRDKFEQNLAILRAKGAVVEYG